MIIQCEQCRTKFKLDDSKVPDKGAKVRCAKCRSVFSVARDTSEPLSGSGFENVLDASVASSMASAGFQPAIEEADTVETFDADEPEVPTAFEEPVPFPVSPAVDEAPEEVSFGYSEPEETVSAYSEDLDDQTLDFDTSDNNDLFPPVQQPVEEPAASDDLDFGTFAFNEDETESVEEPEVEADFDFGDAPKAALPPEDKDFGGLDFSDDDMFGAVKQPDDEQDTAAGLDFGMDDFASSMGVDDKAASQKGGFALSDASPDSPFSLDEIDFGDELTSVGVQHVNPEELKPSQEILFAPLAEAQAKPLAAQQGIPAASSQEELPPLPIASRRKQSPFMSVVFTVCGVVIAAVLGLYGYSLFTGGKGGAGPETGVITIQNVEAMYVKNKVIGELVVISGEAVNNYGKPRAAIKVRGLLYDTKGDEISSATAFGGNPLTKEQLATLTMDKIEAAMGNQFGDSLANMEVGPGKSIPFVIVIPKPESGAKDYGVEPVGSTVASVKQ